MDDLMRVASDEGSINLFINLGIMDLDMDFNVYRDINFSNKHIDNTSP